MSPMEIHVSGAIFARYVASPSKVRRTNIHHSPLYVINTHSTLGFIAEWKVHHKTRQICDRVYET